MDAKLGQKLTSAESDKIWNTWDFIGREGEGLELSVVNPTAVLGPVLGADYSHSIRLIKHMLEGQPGCPKINCGFVDVRDVADLHLRAMTHPAASGQRFLAIAGESLWLSEVAKVLQQRLGTSAARESSAQRC
ncbi:MULTISPECIES: hypothetical protein [Stenotrophomonas maltophilia group]|uniref:hypothetical protein n=1 Tax=Stenotrophomonas TaxID=40323 RepID=UPI002090BFE3|nr:MULTISPECIES: hypothetical protein [Stenotrophomonas maltophilia group]MCO5736200.1 hypothetical protein [Stenotrophomonas maltophilia]